jgi:hypothetical protein
MMNMIFEGHLPLLIPKDHRPHGDDPRNPRRASPRLRIVSWDMFAEFGGLWSICHQVLQSRNRQLPAEQTPAFTFPSRPIREPR